MIYIYHAWKSNLFIYADQAVVKNLRDEKAILKGKSVQLSTWIHGLRQYFYADTLQNMSIV